MTAGPYCTLPYPGFPAGGVDSSSQYQVNGGNLFGTKAALDAVYKGYLWSASPDQSSFADWMSSMDAQYSSHIQLDRRPESPDSSLSQSSSHGGLVNRQPMLSAIDHPRDPFHLHPFIQFKPIDPSMIWDLRLDLRINRHALPHIRMPRDDVAVELSRPACHPPLSCMRLFHPRLPWTIDVHASRSSGITLRDLFSAIWTSLRRRVRHEELFSYETTETVKETIVASCSLRSRGDVGTAKGLRRVDFLRSRVLFEGLVQDQSGMWEIMTRTPSHSDHRQRMGMFNK